MLDRTHDDPTPAAAAAQCREITQSAGDFARELRAVGESCAAVLSSLNEVTQAKRRAILQLTASGADRSQPPNGATPTASLASTVEHALSTAETLGSSGLKHPIHMLELAIVQAVAMAVHNTVAADQQLDILAQAVLTRRAALLLGGAQKAGKPG